MFLFSLLRSFFIQIQRADKASADKFKSTFTETENTKSTGAVVESFSLKSTSNKPNSSEKTSDQNKSDNVKVIQSDDQCRLVAAKNEQKNLGKEPDVNQQKTQPKRGARSNRKISEDDLDGMRELLLQSMIKKTRDIEKPPSRTVSFSFLRFYLLPHRIFQVLDRNFDSFNFIR